MGKKIIVSVISDLVTDQRVQKECNSLHKMGYEILLIGRNSKRKFILKELPYKTIRFQNPFKKGPMMYLIFNLQLFFFLLIKKADILWSNDLDTLLPNFLISRLKKAKLIYDSHEYFTESVYKKTSKKIWEWVEKWLFPKLKNVITVNNSIKEVYENMYEVPITVLRNVPFRFKKNDSINGIKLPTDKRILIMQGIGLNEHRGVEEAILMMQYLPDFYILYLIGWGTILSKLKNMVHDLKLESKVCFIDPMPYNLLMEYTCKCYLGLVFVKIDLTEAHLFSLPNKFFDYIQAGIPVVASKGIEIRRIIDKYQVGDFINDLNPQNVAMKIVEIANSKSYTTWKRNAQDAAEDLCWENEELILINFMKQLN